MNIKLTKSANDTRLLRGISIAEIEDVIATGVKSIDKLGILARKDNLAIIYTQKELSCTIKRITLK